MAYQCTGELTSRFEFIDAGSTGLGLGRRVTSGLGSGAASAMSPVVPRPLVVGGPASRTGLPEVPMIRQSDGLGRASGSQSGEVEVRDLALSSRDRPLTR